MIDEEQLKKMGARLVGETDKTWEYYWDVSGEPSLNEDGELIGFRGVHISVLKPPMLWAVLPGHGEVVLGEFGLVPDAGDVG